MYFKRLLLILILDCYKIYKIYVKFRRVNMESREFYVKVVINLSKSYIGRISKIIKIKKNPSKPIKIYHVIKFKNIHWFFNIIEF